MLALIFSLRSRFIYGLEPRNDSLAKLAPFSDLASIILCSVGSHGLTSLPCIARAAPIWAE